MVVLLLVAFAGWLMTFRDLSPRRRRGAAAPELIIALVPPQRRVRACPRQQPMINSGGG